MSTSKPALSTHGGPLSHAPIVEHAVLRPAAGKLEQGLAFLREAAGLCSLAATDDQWSETFRVFRCVEDPSLYLLTGVWPSLDAHDRWITSERNQQLLVQAKTVEVDIIDFFHYSLGQPHLPAWFDHAAYIAIGLQYPIHATDFSSVYAENSHVLSSATKGREGGGWRVEAAEVPGEGALQAGSTADEVQRGDEWIQLSGWNTVEEHYTFARSNPDYGANIRTALFAFRLRHWEKL